MISERVLSRHYLSFWADLLPWSEKFAHLVNLSYERYHLEFESSIYAASERAIVNELAFEWFGWALESDSDLSKISPGGLASLEDKVITKIGRLSSAEWGSLSFSDAERAEARSIANSIQHYFSSNHPNEAITVSPQFLGCGFLDACYGDAIAGNCLIEIKAGDRNFRSMDVRQVLVYAALNKVSEQYNLDDIILLNPRRGIYYRTTIEALCVESGGHSSDDVLSEIVNFVSGMGVSK